MNNILQWFGRQFNRAIPVARTEEPTQKIFIAAHDMAHGQSFVTDAPEVIQRYVRGDLIALRDLVNSALRSTKPEKFKYLEHYVSHIRQRLQMIRTNLRLLELLDAEKTRQPS